MECPESVLHPAVSACIKAKKLNHGIDKFHRCDLKTCKFWNPPFDRTLFVCTTGLHIHRCGNKKTCPLAFDASASGIFACPISGIEMKEQSMTHADVVKVTSKYGTERWCRRYSFTNHKLAKNNKRKSNGAEPHSNKRSKASKVKNDLSCINAAFVSSLLVQIACASPSVPKLVTRTSKLVSQRLSFVALITTMAETMRLYKPTCPCPENYINAIVQHANLIHKYLSPCPSIHTLVATIASLLAGGLEARGVVVYPKLTWFADNMPPLTLYAQVSHLQCRNMSACTRAIKHAIFKDSGIVASLVFRY